MRRKLTPEQVIDSWDTELKEKFMANVKRHELSGCWNWTGRKSSNGYGVFSIGKNDFAHRVLYIVLKGEIPKGFELDHLCRNRICVNPEHLEAVTHRVNVLRGNGRAAHNAKKTHCPKGHPYSKDGTYTYGNSRRCKQCTKARYFEKIKNNPYLMEIRNRRGIKWYSENKKKNK